MTTAQPAVADQSMAVPQVQHRRKNRLGKYLAIAVAALALICGLAQMMWRNSGSGQWEALPEKNGVQVYSLKVPGTSLVKYKGVTRFKAPLRTIVAFMRDPTVCDDIGCERSKVIQRIDERHEYHTFTYAYPEPFKPRQFVVMEQVSQDPQDHSVLVEYLGMPHLIPPDDCCVRVPHMNNKWKLTPVGDGEVEVEYVLDIYEGGFMPAFYSNRISRQSAYGAPRGLGKLINTEKYVNKYQHVELDFIEEAPAVR